MDIGAEVESGLAQVFGIGALLFGFVLWRLGRLHDLVGDLHRVGARVRNHRAGREDRLAYRRQLTRVVLSLAGLTAIAVVLWRTYAYLGVVNYLAREGPVLDSGIWHRLWEEMLRVKQQAVVTAFAALVVWIAEWVIDLMPFEAPPAEKGGDRVPHTFVVPQEWLSAEEALWEERIRIVLESPLLLDAPLREQLESAQHGRQWRRSWPSWAYYVAAYQRLQILR